MKPPVNLPPLSEHSSSREHLRMHKAVLDAINRKIQLETVEIALSYDTATGEGGLHLDPVNGSNNNPGTRALPVKTMEEINDRLRGWQFGGSYQTSPVIRLLGDTTTLGDGIIAGYSAHTVTILGDDIEIDTGLTVAAATDLDQNVDLGSLTVTGYDFTTAAAAGNTYWIRRRISAISAIYAPIIRLGGSTDTVSIGKQTQWSAFVPITTAFGGTLAAGQTVDIVRFPRFPSIAVDNEARFFGSRIDHSSSAQHRGKISWFVVGHTAFSQLEPTASVDASHGVFFPGGIFWDMGLPVKIAGAAFGAGYAGGVLESFFSRPTVLVAVSSVKHQFTAAFAGSIFVVGGFSADGATVWRAIETGEVAFRSGYGGSNNTQSVSAALGGKVYGVGFTVGDMGAPATTWFMDGSGFAKPTSPLVGSGVGNSGAALYP